MSETAETIIGGLIGAAIFVAIIAFDLLVFLPWVFKRESEDERAGSNRV